MDLVKARLLPSPPPGQPTAHWLDDITYLIDLAATGEAVKLKPSDPRNHPRYIWETEGNSNSMVNGWLVRSEWVVLLDGSESQAQGQCPPCSCSMDTLSREGCQCGAHKTHMLSLGKEYDPWLRCYVEKEI